MTGDDPLVAINEGRIREAELPDAGGDLRDLLFGMRSRAQLRLALGFGFFIWIPLQTHDTRDPERRINLVRGRKGGRNDSH